MKRRIETLQPFPFASDFSPPQPPVPDQIILSQAELSALIAEAQMTAAALARDDTLAQEADRISQTTQDLKSVLSGILDLAALLETAAIDEEDRKLALDRVRRLAGTLLDGQADLFRK